jgi:hypothetical protein
MQYLEAAEDLAKTIISFPPAIPVTTLNPIWEWESFGNIANSPLSAD